MTYRRHFLTVDSLTRRLGRRWATVLSSPAKKGARISKAVARRTISFARRATILASPPPVRLPLGSNSVASKDTSEGPGKRNAPTRQLAYRTSWPLKAIGRLAIKLVGIRSLA
jgi:hypothetical protein